MAKVLSAERIEGSDKLLKLRASLGDEERQIIAGIGKKYDPDSLVGREIIIVANLEPRKLRGIMSHGMLLAASNEDKSAVVLLTLDRDVPNGSKVS